MHQPEMCLDKGPINSTKHAPQNPQTFLHLSEPLDSIFQPRYDVTVN